MDAATADLALADYRPRQRLRVPEHRVERPRFPAIDAHNHLGTPFGAEWTDRSAADLAAALDEAGVQAVVDLDGGWGDRLRREIERWQDALPGRVAVFATLDYERWATDASFGETEAARLRDGVAAGARGLKVWKTLGLRARDPGGRLIAGRRPAPGPAVGRGRRARRAGHDPCRRPDRILRPARRGSTSAGRSSGRTPTGTSGRPALQGEPRPTGYPPFDELIDGLEAVVARHPGTTFIGAHVGCAAEDLARVSGILERCPNFHVDLAARIAELGRQPRTARAFVERWADRVLFGTDMGPDPAWYRVYFRFLETADESFAYDADEDEAPTQGRWRIHGLDLPDDVLSRVYRENALRLIRF